MSEKAEAMYELIRRELKRQEPNIKLLPDQEKAKIGGLVIFALEWEKDGVSCYTTSIGRVDYMVIVKSIARKVAGVKVKEVFIVVDEDVREFMKGYDAPEA